MNWLLIGVGIVFAICMIVGYVRGFIKIIVSLATTVLTIVLVVVITPYTAKALKTLTPLDEMVKEKCVEIVTPDLGEIELPDLNSVELPRQKQLELLETADLPEFFKEGLIENNNIEAYKRLAVSGFAEYVGAYLADIVVKMISFLVTFIIVTIVVRAIVFALDIVTALPVLNGFNRIAGILVGMAIAVIIVWIAFFVITLMYNTPLGRDCFVWIQENELLTFLYEKNVIMEFATKL